MIDKKTIQKAIELLIEVAMPAKIIIFGSYAKGDARDDSDLDLLIVEKGEVNNMMEMVRLRRALRPLRIPVDLIVTTEKQVKKWGDIPGTILYPALKEGMVVYEKY